MPELHLVLVQILLGKHAKESPIDLIYLVTTMAIEIFAHEAPDNAPPEDLVTQYTDLVQRSGEILCPLFSPVKHEEFTRNMMAARLGMAGISTNLDLQQRYVAAVHGMVEAGMLINVAMAVETNVWRNLP